MMAPRKHRYEEWEDSLETGEPEPVEEYPDERHLVAGSLWMIAVSMALYFVPVVNGLIAGIVGGYRVGTARNAMTAALGPLLLDSCLLWMVYSLAPAPVPGDSLGQIAIAALVFFTGCTLLLGAAIGGRIAHNRFERLHRPSSAS